MKYFKETSQNKSLLNNNLRKKQTRGKSKTLCPIHAHCYIGVSMKHPCGKLVNTQPEETGINWVDPLALIQGMPGHYQASSSPNRSLIHKTALTNADQKRKGGRTKRSSPSAQTLHYPGDRAKKALWVNTGGELCATWESKHKLWSQSTQNCIPALVARAWANHLPSLSLSFSFFCKLAKGEHSFQDCEC